MNNKYDMEKIHLQKPDKFFVEKLVDDFYDYLVLQNHKSVTEEQVDVFTIPDLVNNPTLNQLCDLLNAKCKEDGEPANYILASVPDAKNGWGGLKGIYDDDYAMKLIRDFEEQLIEKGI